MRLVTSHENRESHGWRPSRMAHAHTPMLPGSWGCCLDAMMLYDEAEHEWRNMWMTCPESSEEAGNKDELSHTGHVWSSAMSKRLLAEDPCKKRSRSRSLWGTKPLSAVLRARPSRASRGEGMCFSGHVGKVMAGRSPKQITRYAQMPTFVRAQVLYTAPTSATAAPVFEAKPSSALGGGLSPPGAY